MKLSSFRNESLREPVTPTTLIPSPPIVLKVTISLKRNFRNKKFVQVIVAIKLFHLFASMSLMEILFFSDWWFQISVSRCDKRDTEHEKVSLKVKFQKDFNCTVKKFYCRSLYCCGLCDSILFSTDKRSTYDTKESAMEIQFLTFCAGMTCHGRREFFVPKL